MRSGIPTVVGLVGGHERERERSRLIRRHNISALGRGRSAGERFLNARPVTDGSFSAERSGRLGRRSEHAVR